MGLLRNVKECSRSDRMNMKNIWGAIRDHSEDEVGLCFGLYHEVQKKTDACYVEYLWFKIVILRQS
jgi:hypothetical protein